MAEVLGNNFCFPRGLPSKKIFPRKKTWLNSSVIFFYPEYLTIKKNFPRKYLVNFFRVVRKKCG